jgi:alkanesulfonate monooxygenase SsuD/methylene tetrahydromethanopterin reductase-like flavin-dependent oxidoreductase (luciferase family)
LIFGIGAGYARTADPALTAIAEREYGAYGIDVVPVRDAINALGETLTIARRLWTESAPFDFEGAHYRLTGAICEPKPTARLPILIGAGGEKRSLRLVAEHADNSRRAGPLPPWPEKLPARLAEDIIARLD